MNIETNDVSYKVGSTNILFGVNTVFRPGKLTVIAGPNGAGKSTLIAALSGQIKPSSGTVRLNARLLNEYPIADIAKFRAVMLQDNAIAFDYLVKEVVELGRYPHRSSPSIDELLIVGAALEACSISHLAQRTFNTLSGGEKARTQLARALAQLWRSDDAKLPQQWLLLDEPTAALDLAHQHALMRTVKSWAALKGVGVIAVLHDINLALRYADEVVVLQEGRLVDSGLAASVLSPSLVSKVWGVDCFAVSAGDNTNLIYVK
jgi:iron complex transport system ATP-binding protein